MPIIRSTFSSRIAAMKANNLRLGRELGAATTLAASGIKYARASDNPGITSRVADLRASLDDQQVYADKADWAMSLNLTADSALSELGDALGEARELAVQLANDSYTAAQRIDMVTLAQGLLDEALNSANVQFGGRYLFAGASYNAPAYDAAGTYQGDTDEPEVTIGDNNRTQVGWDGSDLLQGTGDIIGAFSNLVANLGTGTTAAVQSSLDDFDDAIDQLSLAQVTIGRDYLKAEDAYDLTTILEVELAQQLANDTEADQAESYASLFEAQTAFEAALQVTASSRTSLLFSRI